MSNILSTICSTLVGGIQTLGQGIAQGVNSIAQNLFLTTTGEGASATTTLSTFGYLIVIFAGISLAIGLGRLVFGWIKSLGAR